MIPLMNSKNATTEVKNALSRYLNLNPHRFDEYGAFRPLIDEDAGYPITPIEYSPPEIPSPRLDLEMGRRRKPGPVNPIIDPKVYDDEIEITERIHREAEKNGIKYDLKKCDEFRAQETSRCYRRWKDNELMVLLYPHALGECLQRVRERFQYCTYNQKMPEFLPEYGAMDASGQPLEVGNPDRKRTETSDSNGDEDKKTERESYVDPYSVYPYGPLIYRAPLMPPALHQEASKRPPLHITQEELFQLMLLLLSKGRRGRFSLSGNSLPSRTVPQRFGFQAP